MNSRREVLRRAIALSPLLVSGRARAMSEAAHAERGIAASIERWDAFGIHRTGTDADRATGLWLRDAAAALGVSGTCAQYPMNSVQKDKT